MLDKLKNISLKIVICIIGAIFTLILAFFTCAIFILILDGELPESDYCIEDHECKVGRIIKVDNREITISKETCLENDWWWEKSQVCKINGSFSIVK